jgi:hypothetical protein
VDPAEVVAMAVEAEEQAHQVRRVEAQEDPALEVAGVQARVDLVAQEDLV